MSIDKAKMARGTRALCLLDTSRNDAYLAASRFTRARQHSIRAGRELRRHLWADRLDASAVAVRVLSKQRRGRDRVPLVA